MLNANCGSHCAVGSLPVSNSAGSSQLDLTSPISYASKPGSSSNLMVTSMALNRTPLMTKHERYGCKRTDLKSFVFPITRPIPISPMYWNRSNGASRKEPLTRRIPCGMRHPLPQGERVNRCPARVRCGPSVNRAECSAPHRPPRRPAVLRCAGAGCTLRADQNARGFRS